MMARAMGLGLRYRTSPGETRGARLTPARGSGMPPEGGEKAVHPGNGLQKADPGRGLPPPEQQYPSDQIGFQTP